MTFCYLLFGVLRIMVNFSGNFGFGVDRFYAFDLLDCLDFVFALFCFGYNNVVCVISVFIVAVGYVLFMLFVILITFEVGLIAVFLICLFVWIELLLVCFVCCL